MQKLRLNTNGVNIHTWQVLAINTDTMMLIPDCEAKKHYAEEIPNTYYLITEYWLMPTVFIHIHSCIDKTAHIQFSSVSKRRSTLLLLRLSWTNLYNFGTNITNKARNQNIHYFPTIPNYCLCITGIFVRSPVRRRQYRLSMINSSNRTCCSAFRAFWAIFRTFHFQSEIQHSKWYLHCRFPTQRSNSSLLTTCKGTFSVFLESQVQNGGEIYFWFWYISTFLRCRYDHKFDQFSTLRRIPRGTSAFFLHFQSYFQFFNFTSGPKSYTANDT